MNLESAIKFFSPKSPNLSDAPAATGDRLAISDVMAALGLTEAQARLGFELFLSKMGITSSERAVEMLTAFGMQQAPKHRAMRELSGDARRKLVELLAAFAFIDYSRSAASKRQCPCCKGSGFTDTEVFNMKTHYSMKLPQWAKDQGQSPSDFEVRREVREIARVLCPTCGGKGEISNACRCHGKGTVLDKEQSALLGVPITKTCPKCTGRGFARLPAETVRRAICYTVMNVSEPSWRRNYKPFYKMLVEQCHREEAIAESMLARVTR